jgi:AcrR family transcriptional regulator
MGLKERREREKQDRRRQILDVARALLFEKGLGATSINQIARRAELGVGTLYFYYRNKEEIFAALQEEGLELLCARIDQSQSEVKDPAQKLRRAASAMLAFSREQRDYLDVINCFLAAPQVLFAPSIKVKVDRHASRVIEMIARLVAQGQVQGRFAAHVDARGFAILFLGAVHGLVQYRKLEATVLQGTPFEQVFCAAVDHLVDSLAISPAQG